MRIVFLNQFFADGAPTGQLVGDVAAELTRRGHEVTVVAGASEYASSGCYLAPDGVQVHRVSVMKFGRAPGARMLSWMSFLGLSAVRSLKLKRQDMVVSLTTPPALSVTSAMLSKHWGAQFWIWEMDVYPDVATTIGVVREDSLSIRAIGSVIDWSRRRANGIVALGGCMRNRLISHGLDPARIVVRENWTDGKIVRPHPHPEGGPLRILYSGNLGLAHEVETIETVLSALGRDSRFDFRFVGGGAQRASLEAACRKSGARNVAFLPYCNIDELSASFAASDISLVTLRNECVGTVVPSKVYTAFAAGRPVLFIGPLECESARVIEKFRCGWVFRPGAGDRIVETLSRLAGDRQAVATAGKNAYSAFTQHYDVTIGAAALADTLEGVQAQEARLRAGE